MERKDRPVGREKNVIGGSAHVERRKGAGPVGGSAQRPQGGGGGSNRQGGNYSGGGGGGGLLKLILVAVVALLGGGGALFGGLLGGGGDVAPATPVNTAAVSTPSGTADTTVSKDARDKRVVLKGDGTDTTTVLVYMCGTDLESNGGFATKDLQEMANAQLGDRVNLLVFTGGCKGWKNSVIDAGKNQIYQVKDGTLTRVWEGTSLQPMTDPATLSGFIQWGAKNFSADRYELIFWDHGGGSLSGYGYDEVYPRNGSMTLDGIAKALKDGGVIFDFVGFDACLMATLETALVVEPYADYLIASEETEPGCGWYYTDWLTALGKSPSSPALEIGKNICDSFVQDCARVAARQQATLSVIDLAELHGTVPAPFKNFAVATGNAVRSDNYQAVASARSRAKEFGKTNKIDQVDLIHLADTIGSPEGRALAQALRGAVKYNATSSNIQNANGVSIYFPYARTGNVGKMVQIYDKIDLDNSYSDCVKSFASLEVAGQAAAGGSNGQMDSLFTLLTGSSGSSGSSGGQMNASVVAGFVQALFSGRSADLTPEEAAGLDRDLAEGSAQYIADHHFDPSALVWTKKNGESVLALADDQWDLIQSVELNVFVDDGEGYIDLGLDNTVSYFNDDGDLTANYDRTWLSVNGQIVAYYTLETVGTQDNYTITGYIPAFLNEQRVDLMVCFTSDDPKGSILGAQPRYDEDTETATLARGLIEIEDGDVIDFYCNYYDYDRNFQDAYYLGEPLKVKGPLTLGDIRMDNEDYIASYRLTDIYNNHYWTPAIK